MMTRRWTIRAAAVVAAAVLTAVAGAAAGTLRATASPAGAARPAMIVTPVPGSATAAANTTITIVFKKPVKQVLGENLPTITPAVAGAWSQPGPDRLVFTPDGLGFGAGTTVSVTVDPAVSYSFQTAPASLLRLEQILAQLQYLPLTFTPAAGVHEPTTLAAEVATMSQPLPGTFQWRWPSVPASLQSQWSAGSANVLVKGALMSFDSVRGAYNGYQMDPESVTQLADAATWQALLQAALANQVDPNPYSYVLVTKTLPQTLTLWENGSVVLTSPANTGIAEAPTADGTFPIYMRYSVNHMTGVNPNGTPYNDLVYWINYFNGGDAVHGFQRSSYGTPQSLGCVELPVSTAHTAFNDLAIGDLVTVSG